jgi:DNA polymerase-1
MDQPPIKFIKSKDAFLESVEPLISLKEGVSISLDIEATSLDPFTGQIILIQIGTKDFINVYDIRGLPEANVLFLLEHLRNKEIIAHNAKFEWKYIYEKYGVELNWMYDTMNSEALIMAGIGRPFYSLNDLTEKYCNTTLDKETRKIFENNPDVKITPELIDYAAADVIYLPYIRDAQEALLKERKSLRVHDMEMRLLPVVAKMEHTGVLLNKKEWTRLAREALATAHELSEQIKEMMWASVEKHIEKHIDEWEDARDMLSNTNVSLKKEHRKVAYSREYLSTVKDAEGMLQVYKENFNNASPKQLKRVFHIMRIPVESTNSKYLKRDFPNNKFAMLTVSYREWLKRATSFGFNFFDFVNEKTGRIHSQFNQLGTATGRFSSEKVNLQNVLKENKYRNCFMAKDGNEIITADYSQIELVIAAEISQEPMMLAAFLAGENLHEQTAIEVLNAKPEDVIVDKNGDRKDNDVYTNAKSTNFAIIYGTSAKGLALNFGIPHKAGLNILKRHKEVYPRLHAFIDLAKQHILMKGYSITQFGRKRYFTIPKRFDKYTIKEKFKIEREGFNFMVQGGSADMLKLAMINISELNPFGEMLQAILTVHDEIVYEVHKSIAKEASAFIEKQMVVAGEGFIKTIPVKVGLKRAPYWVK